MRNAAFKTPGVYLRGVESQSPLPTLSAVTGFVGVSEKGPLHSPQPIQNWGEFLEVFGDIISYGLLPHAVYGFFLNGGRKCYVVRVANPESPSENAGDCPYLDPRLPARTAVPILDRNDDETITISAINEGRWGNEIRIAISYNARKAKLTQPSVPTDSKIHVDTPYDFAVSEKITIISRKVTQSFVISNINAAVNTISVSRPVKETFLQGSFVFGPDSRHQATVTHQADSESTLIRLDTIHGLNIGEEITISSPEVRQSYGIASVALDENTITLTDPVNEAFPEESVISGQRLSQRPIPLARLVQETAATDTLLKVDSAVDFVAGDQLWIVHETNPLVKRSYPVQGSDIAGKTITLESALGETFPKESIVLGRGFRMTVWFRDRREDFEDLSMNRYSPHFFAYAINDDGVEPKSYIEKKNEGHSILIRVEHVTDSNIGRFRPNPGEYRLAGGGDGFTYATGTLKDSADADSIAVVARLRGRRGNNIHVRCEPFQTLTALGIPEDPSAPRNQITVVSTEGFSVNDTLKIASESTNESRLVTGVLPEQNILTLDSDLSNSYPIGSAVSVDNRFTLFVFEDHAPESIEESHHNLSLDSSDPDHFFRTRINNRSQYICVEQSAASIVIPKPQVITLNRGRDPGNIDFRYYTGYDNGEFFTPSGNDSGSPLGAATFERIAEINLLSLPDLWQLHPDGTQEFQTDYLKGLDHCLYHCRKMGERLALLDLPPGTGVADAAFLPSRISNADQAKFGALYYPGLVFTYQQETTVVPPSGFVAGLIGRSDALDGVNKAPTNLNVKGIVGLERSIDAEAQAELNIRGINCFREFDNIGIKLWGSRTLSPELPYLYLNSRRVLLGIIKALSSNLLWAVFEPNDRGLWKRIESSLNAFLSSLLIKGMMASDRPEDAFYVKCDDETNTRESIKLGQVMAEIGVALVAPAEFIVIIVKKTADSLNVTEEGV